MRSRPFTLLLLSTLALTQSLAAQPSPPRPEAQIRAMAKLDYMPGSWKGTGWIAFGDRRVEFRGSETVQSKLGGTALLVEGHFVSEIGGREVPVHTTLGVVSYDPKGEKYRFTTWLGNGSSGERELTLTPRGWYWDIDSPRGSVRYEMTLDESGEWIETGRRKSDSGEWQTFFEMRLRKE